MKKRIFALCFLLSGTTLCAAGNYHKDFVIRFDTGNTYAVSIRDNALTWKGIAGEDNGLVQRFVVKRMALANHLDVFQWQEPRGYFVTFILDSLNKQAITSTKAPGNQDSLVSGKVSDLQ